jgi:arylformamidase
MAFPTFGPATNVFDVTAPLSPGVAVWPGDPSVQFTPVARVSEGAPCNVSRLSCSTHAGTHVDAPWHFVDDGCRVDDIPVERWIGPCWVMDASRSDEHITVVDLESAKIPEGVDRLIIRTMRDHGKQGTPFDPVFVALNRGAARWLLSRGFTLVGIDSPSIEPFDDARHEIHHELLSAGVLIIEGLELSEIEPGPYLLICLPLRLADADGSPARVLLVRDAS